MAKRVTITDKRFDAINAAVDFIHTNIDQADDDCRGFYEEVTKTLNGMIRKDTEQ